MTGRMPREVAHAVRFSTNDDRHWDALVVGAGPAGASAAFHLASGGHSVLVLDKSAFPREKVCGDALIPDALSSLRHLGLYDSVRQAGFCVNRIAIYSPSGIRVELPAECVTLRRARLDALILDAAVKKGAVFRVGTVTEIRQASNKTVSATVRGSTTVPRARVLVLATGADITLLERLGTVQRREPSAIAVRCYVKSPIEMEELMISFDRTVAPGYAWIFPLGNQEYNVGCGVFFGRNGRATVNLREAFSRFVTKAAVARSVMRSGTVTTRLKGARLRAGLRGGVPDRWTRIVPIGETIGTTYPFTGEGIGKAMETGSLAAKQIHLALTKGSTAPLAELASKIERDLEPKYRGYLAAQHWLSRPWLTDLLAIRVRLDESLQETAAGIMNETVDPSTVFNWRNLAPGWLRLRARGSGSKSDD